MRMFIKDVVRQANVILHTITVWLIHDVGGRVGNKTVPKSPKFFFIESKKTSL